MEKPLVSVITPAYKSARFIADTITSVKNQTFSDWEMIVVDDASPDNTERIVTEIAQHDARIRFAKLSKNSGAGVARQTALDMARGRYIAFLDADDLWKPEKLEKQLHFLSETNQGFAFSAYDCIDQHGKPTGVRVNVPKRLTYRGLFFCNFVGNLTGIYDTEVFGKIPISTVRKRQDWILWLHILKKLKRVQSMQEPLALYRVHGQSLSSSKLKLLRDNYAVYRRHHGLNSVAATLAMAGFLFVQLLVKPMYKKRLQKRAELL